MDNLAEADRLRKAARHHFEYGNFETSERLLGRAFEIEHAPVVVADTAVIL